MRIDVRRCREIFRKQYVRVLPKKFAQEYFKISPPK
jgi:predicted nuclease with RNAse H fold